MIYIGNHVSVSDGYLKMGEHEAALGGDTFAFFPRNPRGGRSRTPSPEDVAALRAYLKSGGFGPLVAHAAYTMNVCAANPDTRRKSREMLRDDLTLLQSLPGHFYNLHPGCHVGQGVEAGIDLIAEALAEAMDAAERAAGMPLQTTVLLETMAGKGTEIGGTFEELRAVLDRAAAIGRAGQVGVCFDTCHAWDAGYDIRSDLDGVLTAFDRAVGLERLRAVHLNDSKNPRGSRKDRHEKLGQGQLGAEALARAAGHPALQGRPFILETPNDDDGYAAEIRMVRAWIRP